MTAPYIELANVVRSYDGRSRAVDGINLTVAKGEFVTFLGPSGSGKTTTLMMLAGFEEPDEGRIMLAGKDITHVRSWKRNIGVVFQNYALFPHMTVQKNVAFPLKMRKVDSETIERKPREVLKLVGLSDFADRRPTQLSGGQQQRVALARGLVFEPDVLLLDEPLGALDKNLREQMQVELKRIHREVGITMIYVTHDQSEAMTMSDRVVVFRGGQIEQVGGPIELYDRPRTRFVGEFIGDSNVLELAGVNEAGGSVKSAALGEIKVARFNPKPSSASRYLLVRPEEIVTVAPGSPGFENSFPLEIATVIQYGNESVLIGTVSGTKVSLRVRVSARAGRDLPASGTVRVGWPVSSGYVV
ncbi:ABC transporter ATP-binding protein [Microbacteriaceae bacterium K1510]|nr:ABC transporter ATP-binding protein [Microbacteriaceae bacterium K1510]